jgi:hypothetical protein
MEPRLFLPSPSPGLAMVATHRAAHFLASRGSGWLESTPAPPMKMRPALLVLLAAALTPVVAQAFCGFYVAKADSKLFNKASQVVLVRDGNRTVLTMANDYQGEPKDFAIVIPVPTVIKRDAVQVMDKALIDHIDAYSAPRLVEYFDDNPCEERVLYMMAPSGAAGGVQREAGAKALGVKIEESFTVGEYDILVLSAEQSDGLVTWLETNGYKLPKGAGPVLGSYIKQNVKFFVAKVNLAKHQASGFTYLRPLRVEFKTPKFMLPIRLGTVNATGPQELFIYTLTKKGRVETTNYRTVKLPTDVEVPLFVRDDFPRFYRDMFARAVQREEMRTLFTEYAWDVGWCDPCAADPMTNDELRKFGADWLHGKGSERPEEGKVFLTRLHLRYDRAHFPEDLVFQETGDNATFQGKYAMRHPWKSKADCAEAKKYLAAQPKARETEAQNLARLTGWKIETIRERAGAFVDKAKRPKE